MKQILIAVLALALGGAGGYFLAQPKAVPQQKVEAKTPDKRDATIKKLTADIKNLKADITALKDKLAKAKKAVPATEKKVALANPLLPNATNAVSIAGVSPEEAEEMRPKVMSIITNAFAKASSKRQNAMQAKLDILASVDTSKLTAAQRKTHERYQKLLAKQTKLREKFMGMVTGAITGGGSTAKMDGESVMEMMSVDKEVAKLAQEERANLLTQMVQTMGYTGDTATEMTDTIGAIYTATEATKGGGLGALGDVIGNIGDAAGATGAEAGETKAEAKVITIGM